MAGNEWDIKVLALDGWMVKLKLSSQEKKENLLDCQQAKDTFQRHVMVSSFLGKKLCLKFTLVKARRGSKKVEICCCFVVPEWNCYNFLATLT